MHINGLVRHTRTSAIWCMQLWPILRNIWRIGKYVCSVGGRVIMVILCRNLFWVNICRILKIRLVDCLNSIKLCCIFCKEGILSRNIFRNFLSGCMISPLLSLGVVWLGECKLPCLQLRRKAAVCQRSSGTFGDRCTFISIWLIDKWLLDNIN